jgi:two-component system, OmpR family, phosphate regulon sensor histidine kinase PhoR
VHVPDVGADPRVWPPERVRAEGIASMLSVAIAGRTGPMGVLRAYGAPGHRFTDEDVTYLQAVAAHGAAAIENAKAYKLLADLDRDKSLFLRITTHELRSPVRVTESLLMTLADGYVGAIDAAQADVVRRAQRRLASLHALIDDLLDLAAGKVQMTPVDRRTIDVNAVAREVVERLGTIAADKGVALTLHQTDGPACVSCDPSDLERILVNLIGNAVKYTPQGSVRVTITQDAHHVGVAVRDTGIGIPADALPNLFKEFYRAPNAKATEESGTGLGLSIVQLLLNRYGGSIDIQSQDGIGTTFTAQIPSVQSVP